jgi:7-cyano-7-deazaguanine synthase
VTKCVVLFSGGLDSSTALVWARNRYDKVFPLTFDYGQRHRLEVRMASHQARRMRLPHTVLKVDLRPMGGSALTDRSIPLPRLQNRREMGTTMPSTYVPFRNGILIGLAASWAEPRGVRDIITGFNTLDSPNYPDTRPDFVTAMETALNAGTTATFDRNTWQILTPFTDLKKSEIIRLGLALGADYAHAVSCYSGREVPCCKCSACVLRETAWEEVGLPDPLLVRLKKEKKL